MVYYVLFAIAWASSNSDAGMKFDVCNGAPAVTGNATRCGLALCCLISAPLVNSCLAYLWLGRFIK